MHTSPATISALIRPCQQPADIRPLHPYGVAVIDDVRALIRELRAEGMNQVEIGKAFGRSQGWVSQVLDGTIGEVKAETLRTVQARLPGRLRGQHLIRDDDVPRALEEYFAEREASGRPVRSKVADRARASARSTGMATRTEAAALVDFLEGVVAREERGDAPPPNDPRAVINEAAGQRGVSRKTRKR